VVPDVKVSRVALVSKEGHGEAKQVARDVAHLLLSYDVSVTSFPNLHAKGVNHVPSIKDLRSSKIDLVITLSGDGTILSMLRALDNTIPCLCVNVGGRGVLAELKPDQVKRSIAKILRGEFNLERRTRIQASVGNRLFPPALNEVYVLRNAVSHTPRMELEFEDGAKFYQRMDGVLISTPTGSTGHAYSYGGPFVEGSLAGFIITPIGSINRFPVIVKRDSPPMRLKGDLALKVIIDGQEVFNLRPDTYVTFKKHERDAVFVRFDGAGSFRQLKNLGFA
jgi:NAD+ kinase